MPMGKYDRGPALRAKYIGQRFGRLVVVDLDQTKQSHARLRLLCQCDCGNMKSAQPGNLKAGKTTSCGCLVSELNKKRSTHGKAHSPEWSVWRNMVQRCTKPHNKKYAAYGGRGITVCDDWLKFANFYQDMGDRPSPVHQIDRIDNDKGYSKDNCRWATKSENMLNRRVLSTSKTGIAGVRERKSGFYAELKINGILVLAKTYPTLEEAAAARKAAEQEHLHNKP